MIHLAAGLGQRLTTMIDMLPDFIFPAHSHTCRPVQGGNCIQTHKSFAHRNELEESKDINRFSKGGHYAFMLTHRPLLHRSYLGTYYPVGMENRGNLLPNPIQSSRMPCATLEGRNLKLESTNTPSVRSSVGSLDALSSSEVPYKLPWRPGRCAGSPSSLAQSPVDLSHRRPVIPHINGRTRWPLERHSSYRRNRRDFCPRRASESRRRSRSPGRTGSYNHCTKGVF